MMSKFVTTQKVLFKGWLSPPDALSQWQETRNFWYIIQIGETLDITFI